MGNPDAPHVALVGIKAEVFERNPDGSYDGAPRKTEERRVCIEGGSLEETVGRLLALLQHVRRAAEL